MSETFRLSDYQIRIGKEDVIERHMHGILSDDPENTENQDKAKKALGEVLKEMRVRFGTILKTGYFREIVPGIYGQMLDQLPALAPRSALVPGECVQAPALAEMREAGPMICFVPCVTNALWPTRIQDRSLVPVPSSKSSMLKLRISRMLRNGWVCREYK